MATACSNSPALRQENLEQRDNLCTYFKQKGFHISQKFFFQHLCSKYSTLYTYINYFFCIFFVGLGIWPGKVIPKYLYLQECK